MEVLNNLEYFRVSISSPTRYCSADNIYCSLGAFAFYATTGSTLYLQAVLAITRYNFVCSKYRWPDRPSLSSFCFPPQKSGFSPKKWVQDFHEFFWINNLSPDREVHQRSGLSPDFCRGELHLKPDLRIVLKYFSPRVDVRRCLLLCLAGFLTPFIICSVPFTGLWGQYGYEEGTGKYQFGIEDF